MSFTDKIVAQFKSLLWALVVVMVVRTFFYQLFNIPSGSMHPNLMEGDFLIVNKMTYGYGNHSFPFSPPILSDRIFAKVPKRGEIVVFHNPHHRDPITQKMEGADYIKRLIGLPGDRIQVTKGVLHINGKAVKLEPAGTYQYIDTSGQLQVVKKLKETFPDGNVHIVLRDPTADDAPHNNTDEFVVPKGHFFMMGDNRDHSQDSRWLKEVGYVPFKNLMGRAELLVFSTGAKWYEIMKWPFSIRFDRIMTQIH